MSRGYETVEDVWWCPTHSLALLNEADAKTHVHTLHLEELVVEYFEEIAEPSSLFKCRACGKHHLEEEDAADCCEVAVKEEIA